jgi:hypothetical protein
MGLIQRLAVAMATTMGSAGVAIIYFRAGEALLFEMIATDGPFSSVIGWVETVVPIALAILIVGVWSWVIWGGVPRERAREVRAR